MTSQEYILEKLATATNVIVDNATSLVSPPVVEPIGHSMPPVGVPVAQPLGGGDPTPIPANGPTPQDIINAQMPKQAEAAFMQGFYDEISA